MTVNFTSTGEKIIGSYENDRNSQHSNLYKAIIRKVFGVQDVIIAHHLVYVKVERRKDDATGLDFDYQIIEEVPAADTLIFDHVCAKALWGDDWLEYLRRLVCEPTETRDQLLQAMFEERHHKI